MTKHITYHPLSEELMKQYVVFVMHDDGATYAADHCDQAGLDATHRARFLEFLPHFATPADAPFDQTHGFSIALTQGFFDTYFYVNDASLSTIRASLEPYSVTWQALLPGWELTHTAQNRLGGNFSSGIYIPADKIAPLMNDAHSVPALAEALGSVFPDTKLEVLWAALLRANELGVGLLEAVGALEPDPSDLMATTCFTKFENCDSASLAHFVDQLSAPPPPPPPAPAAVPMAMTAPPVQLASAVTEDDWQRLLATIASPFGAASMLAATFAGARTNAGELNALTGATKALGMGLWFDWKDGHLLEQGCRDLVDQRIGWSDDDFRRMAELQFAWQGADTEVNLGLEAFDRWLLERNTGWRLVGVETGADFYLSVLSPTENNGQLIGAFAAAGLKASLQDGSQPGAPSTPPPPPHMPAPPPPLAPVPPPPWESPANAEPLPWEVAAANFDKPGTRLPGQPGLAERLRAKREEEEQQQP